MSVAAFTADALELRTVDAGDWRGAAADAIASGRRFASLHALEQSGNPTVRALFDGVQPLLLSCSSVDATVPTIIDIVPAATWDEREAHDLYGVRFDGHSPLRPLVNHSVALDDWVVPVHGHGPYDVAVGPIHAGVIESGHF
ncbi:MAG TPA: NADH-quinone oxidoreductase subunit C, partial [Gaiellaceae bacterium]|nr:NADH-quinone oxidoreductase subunit C [Gaiellaceae bacterium]